MQLFMKYFLAGFLVQVGVCEKDSNYYVIEMPDAEDESTMRIQQQRTFKAYWNVPTMQCQSKGIPFDDLFEKYGIQQNKGDRFKGEKITIFYDPGLFPALFSSSPGGYRFRNGGVPQEGSVQKHLDAFKLDVEESLPANYDGVAVIDFESWRPIFRQNFGVLLQYKNVSYDIERKVHWWWPKSWIETAAKERFERAARIFMEATISIAKKLRPKAIWGYYAYPYCFNYAVDKCASQVNEENDSEDATRDTASFYDEAWYEYATHHQVDARSNDDDNLNWMWAESTGLFPSIYSSKELKGNDLASFVRGRVGEATRVAGGGAVLLPYYWYRYRDGGFFRENDLKVVLKTLYNSKASGFIIWGSSKDVDTKEKCLSLLDYVTKTFGPAVAKYTKGGQIPQDDEYLSDSTTDTTTQGLYSLEYSQSDENIFSSEPTTSTIKPITEFYIEASTEPINHQNATQELENVSDFLETDKNVKPGTASGEIVLNSIIQFFDMAENNGTFNDVTEQPEYTQNPDDTPGFTQNEMEQELKSDTFADINEPTLSIKRKDILITPPYTNSWRSIFSTTPTAISTNDFTTELFKTTITETTKQSSTVTTLGTTPNSSTETTIFTTSTANTETTTFYTTPPKNKTNGDSAVIVPDSDKDSNEILNSLTKLSGSLYEENSAEYTTTITSTSKDDYDDLTRARKFLQDLADNERQYTGENTLSSSVNDKDANDLKSFYNDFTASGDPSADLRHNDKNKDINGPDILEDDMILEAVAEILNATERAEVENS